MNQKMKKPLAVGCVFLIACAVFFVLLLTCDRQAIGPCGTVVGLAGINNFFRNLLGQSELCYIISAVLELFAILPGAIVGLSFLHQMWKRKSIWAPDWELWITCWFFAASLLLYGFFEIVVVNYRPILEAGQTFPEASFPSSHTMVSVVIAGSSARAALEYFSNPAQAKRISRGIYIVALIIMVTRWLSGVHWFTDILGALLIGGCLLSFHAALLEVERKKVRAFPPKGTCLKENNKGGIQL